MKNLFCEYFSCEDLIKYFGKDKFEKRYNTTLKMMEEFISTNDLSGKVFVDRMTLANVIIDYFSDVKRLKEFHKDIKKINSEKVISYMSYWILRRKPLQIIRNATAYNKDLITINERFVLQIYSIILANESASHTFYFAKMLVCKIFLDFYCTI